MKPFIVKPFETHALQFAIACVIHNLNIELGKKNNRYLKGIPQIKSYKAREHVEILRFKAKEEKDTLIELLVLPANWPKNYPKEHNIQIDLKKINNEWIITQLCLYYQSIMDDLYEFEVSGSPSYKLAVDLDDIKMRNTFRRHCDRLRSAGVEPF